MCVKRREHLRRHVAAGLNVLNDLNGWNVLNCFEAGAARLLVDVIVRRRRL